MTHHHVRHRRSRASRRRRHPGRLARPDERRDPPSRARRRGLPAGDRRDRRHGGVLGPGHPRGRAPLRSAARLGESRGCVDARPRAPALRDHRLHGERAPAVCRRGRPLRARLQRRDLQLRGTARRVEGPRHRVPHRLRHRGTCRSVQGPGVRVLPPVQRPVGRRPLRRAETAARPQPRPDRQAAALLDEGGAAARVRLGDQGADGRSARRGGKGGERAGRRAVSRPRPARSGRRDVLRGDLLAAGRLVCRGGRELPSRDRAVLAAAVRADERRGGVCA